MNKKKNEWLVDRTLARFVQTHMFNVGYLYAAVTAKSQLKLKLNVANHTHYMAIEIFEFIVLWLNNDDDDGDAVDEHLLNYGNYINLCKLLK